MSPSASLVDDIEHPPPGPLSDLLEQACDETRRRMDEWSVQYEDDWEVRKMSYTYYHREDLDDPDYVFLIQDPGGLQRRHTEELPAVRDLRDDFDPRALVDVYRQFAKTWLIRNNGDFGKKFFGALDEHGLIDIGSDWRVYLQEEDFFDDFYVTDVVKYRVDGFTTTQERASVDTFLSGELAALDPDLIFSFGGGAWSAVREYLGAERLGSDPIDEDSVMEVHGELCETTRVLDTHVLPLAHMSGQVWWRFPPEDYIERMTAALAEWNG